MTDETKSIPSLLQLADEAERLSGAAFPGEWEATLCDGKLMGDEPVWMVRTPPQEERKAAIAAHQPYTSRRVALLHPSYYMTLDECEANAKLCAASRTLVPQLAAAVRFLAGEVERLQNKKCVHDMAKEYLESSQDPQIRTDLPDRIEKAMERPDAGRKDV